MQIGNIKIDNPFTLAPMAGISDLAFRLICREFGVGLTVSEMVSAKAIYYKDKKTYNLMQMSDNDSPCSLQLFGHEPDVMAYAAAKTVEFCNPPIIDINMGCPVPKVVSNGDGSALMNNPRLIFDIVNCVKKAVDRPVTVKLRAGFKRDNLNAVECAKAAESGEASAVIIHGKTREQYYAPPVNLDIIKEVKGAVKIPVIGNGEVYSFEDAKKMMEYTRCDGVMIGRGSLGNPFIFRELNAGLNGVEFNSPTIFEKMETAKKHIKLLTELKGEHIGMLEARKHMSWYLKGVKGSASIRNRINSMEKLSDLIAIADEVLENNKGG